MATPLELSRQLFSRHAACCLEHLRPAVCTHAPVAAELTGLAARSRGVLSVHETGRSLEGRPIFRATFGTGPTTVLLWSQMHGDEPTATCALVDILSHLVATSAEPATKLLLSRLTLLVVPMLNPDGAVRNDRRNAQGIDVNRDALELQTPEGRFLKGVRDRFSPVAGFNLHNQSGLVLAGAKEMKDTSLKNLKDVRAYTNLAVLSSIPLLENALLIRRKRRLLWLAWSSAIIIGSIAMSGSAYYYYFGHTT